MITFAGNRIRRVRSDAVRRSPPADRSAFGDRFLAAECPYGHTTNAQYSRRSRGGFSLAEIMIAVAILAVGLSMVMAVFPAAIETNKDSTADVIGTIICDNAMTIIKSQVTSSLSPGTFFGTTPVSLSAGDQCYPMGDVSASRGFLALARRMGSTGLNDYQFVIVSYLKKDPTHQVRVFSVSTSDLDASKATEFTVADVSNVKIGSPVIDPGTGAYAKVISLDTPAKKVFLDHPLDITRPASTMVSAPLVIVETNAAGIPLSGLQSSPATRVLVGRTALRP